ncbi:hypothetical protein PR048_026313, partial [Dryococelus australis]
MVPYVKSGMELHVQVETFLNREDTPRLSAVLYIATATWGVISTMKQSCDNHVTPLLSHIVTCQNSLPVVRLSTTAGMPQVMVARLTFIKHWIQSPISPPHPLPGHWFYEKEGGRLRAGREFQAGTSALVKPKNQNGSWASGVQLSSAGDRTRHHADGSLLNYISGNNPMWPQPKNSVIRSSCASFTFPRPSLAGEARCLKNIGNWRRSHIYKGGTCRYNPIGPMPPPVLGALKVLGYRCKNVLYCFVEGRSAEQAIYSFTEKILTSFDKTQFLTGIFADLSKAYDCVDHNILLQKLEQCRVRGVTNNMFELYLEDRKQITSIRYYDKNHITDVMSNTRTTRVGEQQGSILGAILFLIFINDFTEQITNGSAIMFAGDTNIMPLHHHGLHHLKTEELREFWGFVTTKVLRANEGEIWHIWSSIEMQGWGKQKNLEKTCQPAASISTITIRENLRVTSQGNQHWWKASVLPLCHRSPPPLLSHLGKGGENAVRQPSAGPIRNIPRYAVANRTQGSFPEPRGVNKGNGYAHINDTAKSFRLYVR